MCNKKTINQKKKTAIKLLISFITLLLITIPINAQKSDSISLSDCLNRARQYHPFYSDKQRIDQSRELRLKNVKTLWFPQLSFNAQATYQSEATKIDVPIPGVNISGTPLDQYKITMDVNQVVYDGGLSSAQKKVTNASVDADMQQNATDIYKINEQVTGIYFNTLLLQVSKEIYKNTLEDLSSKEKKIVSGVRNGILIESDLDNLKVEILKTKQLLNEIELARSNSLWVLNDLTGDSSVLTTKLSIPEFGFINDDSVKRPELKLFDLQQNILDGNKYVSTSQRLPKVYAFSQLGYGRPGLNMLKDDFQPFYIVGLKLQWNIWDWNKSSREKSLYSVQQEMVDSKRENYLRNVNISGNNEITRIKQLHDALVTDQEILNLRKSITRQSEHRMEQGIITMTDYLNDYNAELKAGLQLETHKIQLIQSKANYLIIKGIL